MIHMSSSNVGEDSAELINALYFLLQGCPFPQPPFLDLVQPQTSHFTSHEMQNSSNSTALGQTESKLPEILILTSQPGRHLPTAQERNHRQGGSRSLGT